MTPEDRVEVKKIASGEDGCGMFLLLFVLIVVSWAIMKVNDKLENRLDKLEQKVDLLWHAHKK